MNIFKSSKNLGELEAEIMEILWKNDHVSVREVFEMLNKKRKIAYTTVMTVMSRLCDKNILTRKLDSNGAYIYKSAQDKKSFLKEQSRQAISYLIHKFGDVAVAQFIDIIEGKNRKKIKEWKKKLKKIL